MPDSVATAPAIVMGLADGSTLAAPAVRLKLAGLHTEVVVKDLTKLKALCESFSPGDAVKRAMLNGQEEDAEVCAASQKAKPAWRCRPGLTFRAQVVRVDSATAVTIRIKPSGVVYSSDIKRLRKVLDNKARGDGKHITCNSAPASNEASQFTEALDIAALASTVSEKFAKSVTIVRTNPHAMPGTALHQRFVEAAKALEDTKKVDIMLHGTPPRNVDSILQSSLRGRAACGTCWFTDHFQTASCYARGAERFIAFAVLRDKAHAQPIYTTRDQAHHLPLFELAVPR